DAFTGEKSVFQSRKHFMHRSRWFESLVLLGGFLAASPARAEAPEEPWVDGRPLSWWMKALRYPSTPGRRKAAEVLGHLRCPAQPAVPLLIKAREAADAEVCAKAAQALGLIGPEAKQAVPALTRVAKQKKGLARVNAALALWRIDARNETSVPALVCALQEK